MGDYHSKVKMAAHPVYTQNSRSSVRQSESSGGMPIR